MVDKDGHTFLNSIRLAVGTNSGCGQEVGPQLARLFGIAIEEVGKLNTAVTASHNVTLKRYRAVHSAAKSSISNIRIATGLQLSRPEKTKFATEILNISLRVLTDEIRRKQVSSGDEVRYSDEKAKAGIRNTAICASLALKCLECQQTAPTESGYQTHIAKSAFIGKLLALHLHDLAKVELQKLVEFLVSYWEEVDLESLSLEDEGSLFRILLLGSPLKDDDITNLVIVTQLLVLKLAHRDSRLSYSTCLRFLTKASVCPPMGMIESALSKNFLNEATAVKHLASLAQCIRTFCPTTTDDETSADSRASSVTPSNHFKLSICVLRINQLSIQISHKGTDSVQHALEALTKSLDLYVRKSPDHHDGIDREILNHGEQFFLAQSHKLDIDSLPLEVIVSLIEANRALIVLEARLTLRSQVFQRLRLVQGLLSSPLLPMAKKCFLFCKLFVALFNVSASFAADLGLQVQDLVNLLRDETYDHACAEAAAILITASTLRRLLYQDMIERKLDAGLETSTFAGGIVPMYSEIFRGVLAFVLQHLSSPASVQTLKSEPSHGAQRAALVNRIARQTIDAILLTVRLTDFRSIEYYQKVRISLQLSFRLIRALEDHLRQGTLQSLDSRLRGVHTSLSDAYATLYVKGLELQIQPECKGELLESALELLALEKFRENSYFRLASKLESLIQSTGGKRQALYRGKSARRIKSLLTCDGILEKAAGWAGTMPLPQILIREPSLASFISIMAVLLQAEQLEREPDILQFCTGRAICANGAIKGLLIELLFREFLQGLKGGRQNTMPSLRLLIRQSKVVYPFDKFPVRRLRLMYTVIQSMLICPELYDGEAIAFYLNEIRTFDPQNLALDQLLSEAAPGLLACSHLAFVLFPGSCITTSFRQPSRQLLSLLEESNVEKLMGNLDHLWNLWDQIEILSVYFEIHGSLTDVSSCVNILVALHKRRLTQQNTQRTSSLVRKLVKGFAEGMTETYKSNLWDKGLVSGLVLSDDLVRFQVDAAEHLLSCKACRPIHGKRQTSASLHLIERLYAVANMPSKTVKGKIDTQESLTESFRYMSKACRIQGQGILSLHCARAATRSIYKAWGLCRNLVHSRQTGGETNGMSKVHEANDVDTAQDADIFQEVHQVQNVLFWPLVPQLLSCLVILSELLIDMGQVVEARHYVSQALRVAEASNSPIVLRAPQIVQARLWTSENRTDFPGDTLICSGELEPNSPAMMESIIRPSLDLAEAEIDCGRLVQAEKILNYLTPAEGICDSVSEPMLNFWNSTAATTRVDQLNLFKSLFSTNNPKNGSEQEESTLTNPEESRKLRGISSQSQACKSVQETLEGSYLQALALNLRARVAVARGDKSRSALYLKDPDNLEQNGRHLITRHLTEAHLHYCIGIDHLSSDPVSNLLLEAPISCPSRSAEFRHAIERLENERPRRKRKGDVNRKPFDRDRDSHLHLGVQHLRAAIGSLRKVFEEAAATGKTTQIHSASELYNKTRLLFSALSTGGSAEASSVTSVKFINLGRNVAWKRQLYSILTEMSANLEEPQNPYRDALFNDIRKAEAKTAEDNKDIIELLPPDWTVFTLSTSSGKDQLQISKMRRGLQPFFLTIPLNRFDKDEDEAALTFETGKSELNDIISLANFSAHDSPDLSKRGAKSRWWRTRSALDDRLRNLLLNIEDSWLGGFKGIFNQVPAKGPAFETFSASFESILNMYLPSRRNRNTTSTKEYVALDVKILELFIGLNGLTNQGSPGDAVVDLLSFVVDTMQFAGEPNAYDEIDFDLMTAEILAALEQYDKSVESERQVGADPPKHTILVLDRHLHWFPWESLPCLEAHSISRLPSLEALRTRARSLRGPFEDSTKHVSIAVDKANGAYILNPGKDLQQTEETFREQLQSLPRSFSGIVGSVPKEDDVAEMLNSKSLYLYFGHGSGGQYIRGRTIRKMEKCAVSLLMGCRSGSITEAGLFESYGTPLTYLQAGAPAVVGTLWDVTDKDIDRFSSKMLQRWGLFAPKTLPSGNKPSCSESRVVRAGGTRRAKIQEPEKGSITNKHVQVDLDTAVSEARKECFLRYLNGAAPVVYGIPVALK